MHKSLFITIVLLLLIISPVTYTQETDDTCSSVIETALQVTQESCNGLERNQACYGNNRVDVTFWEEQSESVFSTPSDRIPLLDLQSIATSPLNIDPEAWGVAVLNLQTNLPGGLPGQAVTFMLMGDSSIENEVLPFLPVEPIPAIVNANANIRSQPTTTANVVATATAGDEVALVGINEAGDWYEIELETGSAWIWAQLVGAGDVTGLPVTDIGPRYAPMQAFYFRSGVGDLQCNEAPNALIIQNPSGEAVQLKVNDLNVTIGSTVLLSNFEHNGQSLMLITLLEGKFETELNGQSITLEQPDDTRPIEFPLVAITLNDKGRVDTDSNIVDISGEDLRPFVLAGCEVAMTTDADLKGLACDVNTTRISPRIAVFTTSTSTSITSTNNLESVSATDACVVASDSNVNFRGGPGTNYNVEGQLTADTLAIVTGKADGADGYLWWETEGGIWVRSDLVNTGGACDSVPVVEAPEPPVVQTTTTSGVGTGIDYVNLGSCDANGQIISEPVASTFTFEMNWRDCANDSLNAAHGGVLITTVIVNGVDQGSPHSVWLSSYNGCQVTNRSWVIGPLPTGTYRLEGAYILQQELLTDFDGDGVLMSTGPGAIPPPRICNITIP